MKTQSAKKAVRRFGTALLAPGWLLGSGLTTVALFWTGCAEAPPPAPPKRIPAQEEGYLLSPFVGYPASVDAERRSRVEQAHAGLDRTLSFDQVLTVASELLADDPAFHPALVLRAQVQILREDDQGALQTLDSVATDHPGYVAGQLLRGRAAERLGEDLTACRSFEAIADINSLSGRRAEEICPRAAEMVLEEAVADLERHHLEAAEERLPDLKRWLGSDDLGLLDLELKIAETVGDADLELELIERILELERQSQGEGRWDLRVRQAQRLFEIGEVRYALDLYEALAQENPEDEEVREGLARARFRWGLQALPGRVQGLADKTVLDRSDLASLLYWLVPSIRFGEIENPPIATDILDHPQREEIVRVLGLGVLRVDRTLHRFEPAREAARGVALLSLLRVLELSGRPMACLDSGVVESLSRSPRLLCEAAARCGLVEETGECRLGSALSGSEALDLFRHGLTLLGSS